MHCPCTIVVVTCVLILYVCPPRVIESIIEEQLIKLAATLRGLHSLASVAHNTANRLSKLKDEQQFVEVHVCACTCTNENLIDKFCAHNTYTILLVI